MASTSLGVTASLPFFSCNPAQTSLFSVNPGVPSEDALQMVQCFLDDALVAMNKDEQMSFAACRLVEMAKAVLDATVEGLPGAQPVPALNTGKETALLETLKTALGGHPADVLMAMQTTNDAFSRLEALFVSIKMHLERTNSPCSCAKELADTGAYLAQDFANYVDLEHEKTRDSLLAHGIFCGEA